MKILCWLLCLPALMVVAYAVHSIFKYTRMIGNILLELAYAVPQETPSTCRGEKITVLDSGGHEIDAILYENKQATKLVIFCPESGTTKESWEKYAYFFPEMGFNVLSLDFSEKEIPGQISAHFPWASSRDTKRLLTVIRWAKKAFKPEMPVVLFGISKGANIALAASIEEGTAIQAVITDGLFSMKAMFRDYIQKWAPVLVRPNPFGKRALPAWVLNLFANLGFWYCQRKCLRQFINVESLLRQKHPPVLIIHGEEDDYISPAHQTLLGRIPSKSRHIEQLIIPKARHNEAVIIGRSVYEKKINDFLVRHL